MATISRRSFIKGSTASLVLLATGFGSKAYFFQTANAETSNTEEWKPAYCPGCHMPICGTQVKVVNGVAVEIKGDPKSPTNKGKLCPRGNSIIGGLYHPYRVKTPLKRTNPEKGLDIDPGWVEITWDEAYAIVAGKLKEARAYDPRSFIYNFGFGNEDSFSRILFDKALGSTTRIGSAGPLCPDHYGSTTCLSTRVERVDLQYCKLILNIGRSIGDEWALAHYSTSDYATAVERGLKVITVNPRKTVAAQNGEWVPIIPGTDIAFCWALVHTIIYEINKYDEKFLKWRTNAPYLIEDKPQVFKGSKVHIEDHFRDEATQKPLVWDESQHKAVPFDSSRGDTYALTGTYTVRGKTVKTAFQLMTEYVKEYTPEWAEKICTVPAAKIREIAKELVDTAQIGATINIEGFEFPLRPVATFPGRGANCNPLNTELYKALYIINELLGCLDVPGGVLGVETGDFHPFMTDKDGMLTPVPWDIFKAQSVGTPTFEFPPNSFDNNCFYPMKLDVEQLTWKTILDPKSYYVPFEAKVLMIHGANNIKSNADPEPVMAAMRRIPFVFDIAVWLDEASQFADVILPEHHALERAAAFNASFICSKGSDDESRGMRAICARKPVVAPAHNTRLAEDICFDLAERVGCLPALNMITNKTFLGMYFLNKPAGLAKEYSLLPIKKYTYEEIIERKLKSLYGPQSGWNDFAECAVKGYKVPTIKGSYNYFYAPENKIRIPLYYTYSGRNINTIMNGLKEHGIKFPGADIEEVARNYAATPLYYEFNTMLPTAEYPFKVFQFKTHFQVNDSSGLVYNPWLREIQHNFDPNILKVLVPYEAGKAMGLNEDDEIVVESQYGHKTQGKVHLSQMIHPQTIGIGGKWGKRGTHIIPFAKEGPNYNVLLNGDERDIGFLMGNLNNSVCVKIYKA
ncbi:MAG: molybdopterin-dependent oxidoreductase [Dehalobacter sp. 4CP]|uniref:molybdopterin-dependent oxidoreductase n=1 Tax=Dehalobacter sp. CP TaxID=2594474 RepID=UPI0013C585DD|nr:molybdopterin-dependent oxidoreductase [Dehalobacter sp. 4CP]